MIVEAVVNFRRVKVAARTVLSRPRGSLGLSKVETEMTASRPRTSRKSDEPSPEGTPVDGTSTHAPQYVAPRVDHVIHKSGWSRFTYTLTLLNIVVWLPLWLKLISVRRHTGSTTPRSLYDPNIGLALHVPSFDDPAGAEACDVCPNGQDVTYPVAATVTVVTAATAASAVSRRPFRQTCGRDRASPKKSSHKPTFNRRTLYRELQKIPMSSPKLASPIGWG